MRTPNPTKKEKPPLGEGRANLHPSFWKNQVCERNGFELKRAMKAAEQKE